MILFEVVCQTSWNNEFYCLNIVDPFPIRACVGKYFFFLALLREMEEKQKGRHNACRRTYVPSKACESVHPAQNHHHSPAVLMWCTLHIYMYACMLSYGTHQYVIYTACCVWRKKNRSPPHVEWTYQIYSRQSHLSPRPAKTIVSREDDDYTRVPRTYVGRV